MKTRSQRFSVLQDRLSSVENNLYNLAKEISISKETSNMYWSSMTRKTREQYEIARFIYADWTKENMPFWYDLNIRQQIKRIKSMSFSPNVQLNYKEFINKNINKELKQIVSSVSFSDFELGLDMGRKKLNRLLRASQQTNITEYQLNRSVEEGFSEKKSVYGISRKIQNQLLSDALDKKYITVIDKNGDTINYNVKAYADLVARTKYMQSQVDGTINLAVSYGSDLVQVSDHNTTCSICAEYEGKIFSISGNDKRFPPLNIGFPLHPNCMHSLTVYFVDAQPEATLEQASKFSLGESEIHPTRRSHIPVSERELK
jgi:hypothetical protein